MVEGRVFLQSGGLLFTGPHLGSPLCKVHFLIVLLSLLIRLFRCPILHF